MKTLIIMRHGKPVSFGEGFVDFDRPLTFSGTSFLRIQGEKLLNMIPIVDSIAYSPAKRTTETMETIYPFFPAAKQNSIERIYGARAPILENIIIDFPDQVQTLLIIGHNPGVSDLFGNYTKNKILFGTGCFGIIKFDIEEWSDIVNTKPTTFSYHFGK
jgi:phosphohistidine phosphatase